MTVVVTGASGFVGRAVVQRLRQLGKRVRAVTRSDKKVFGADECVKIEDIARATDWKATIQGVDTVIHLAARVHILTETKTDPTESFRRVNVEGTLNLAREAAAAGVRRFLFVSSIKVNGESGKFTEHSPAMPRDAYGISKHEAEIGLTELASNSSLEVTIVRPPLVYGPGVKANFGSLLRAVKSGIPLPLGAVSNQRSLIAVDNLVDFVVRSIDSSRAANEIFLVSDGEDLSTPELVNRIAKAMNKPARLISVSPSLLTFMSRALGQYQIAQRLLGSLQLDISKARAQLQWQPPISVDEGIARAVRGLL